MTGRVSGVCVPRYTYMYVATYVCMYVMYIYDTRARVSTSTFEKVIKIQHTIPKLVQINKLQIY